MHVTVRLFAALREQAGVGERDVELPDGARVEDTWPALGLGPEPGGLLYAVNRAYVDHGHPLRDRDEVALIPPVSGGADVRGSSYEQAVWLTETAIDVDAVIAKVADAEAGAIATFLGTTRVHSRGRTVTLLEYEAYEGMAEQEMARIAEDMLARYELCKIAIAHRVGRVGIGETSVAIAVSAPHRGDAIAACKDAIDTLKETVPLWKKEIYEGGEEWIGRGS
jgi:molybdopterin synthase catalytic subunit